MNRKHIADSFTSDSLLLKTRHLQLKPTYYVDGKPTECIPNHNSIRHTEQTENDASGSGRKSLTDFVDGIFSKLFFPYQPVVERLVNADEKNYHRSEIEQRRKIGAL